MIAGLLEAARAAVDRGPTGPWGGAWGTAAALLIRQALETSVNAKLARFPGARSAPMAARLGALRGLDRDGSVELAATWSWLSGAIHGGEPLPEALRDAATVVEKYTA